MRSAQRNLLAAALAVAQALWDLAIKPTLRQIYYRLVANTTIENRFREYTRLSRVLVQAREDGTFPADGIYDGVRPLLRPSMWDGLPEFGETVARAYRRDYWTDQPNYIEIWSEKDALRGVLEPVTSRWGVPLRIARGYSSVTVKLETAQTIEERIHSGKECHIIYVGDWDPSGINMLEELQEYLNSMLLRNLAPGKVADGLHISRLAVMHEDVLSGRYPPALPKWTDKRTRGFVERWGDAAVCIEADAIPPEELRDRVEAAIQGLVDSRSWNKTKKRERREQERILATVRSWADGAA